jgi:membrane protease YdiL (CAAX protease family)
MSELLFLAGAFGLFALMLMIANLAERRRLAQEPYQGLALVSYLTLIFLYGLALIGGLAVQGVEMVLRTQPELLAEMGMAGDQNPFAQLASIQLFSLGLWLPALIGIVLLLPPVRRLAARLIPIDAGSPVHALALSLISLVAANLLITLGVGLGNLAAALEEAGPTDNGASTLISLWGQQIFTALLAIVGVGWLVRRDWGAAMERLGIVRPTGGQVLLGIVLALLLVPLVLLIEYAASWVGISADADVERLSEQLLGPLFRSPFGIFTVGVAAALGEETLLRGALQPRFGLLLTTLLFALLHSNYGISLSTVVVFLLGLVLGIVRLRANTTTAMIIHAVYNATLGLLVYLGT